MTTPEPGREAARRLLIINADDFGLSSGVNLAVQEAHTKGILTSATLLANGPAFSEAVELSRSMPNLGVGVHLNIVRGQPLSDPASIPALTGHGGVFKRFRVARLSWAFLDQAAREYRLQIERVVAAGIRPTHIDFEKHHAWQGPLYALACRLAAEYGIGAARTLQEPVAWTLRTMGWAGISQTGMAAFLRSGFDLGGGRRCPAIRPDRLLGQAHIGNMTEDVWLRLARRVPPGISEVMTHPGKDEPEAADSVMGDSWLARKRHIELAALLSPRVRDALAASGVELVNFSVLGTDKNRIPEQSISNS